MHGPFSRLLTKKVALCACLFMISLQLAGCGSREQRAERYYKDAMGYLDKKDFVKARIELRNALQLKGDMVPAWRALAQVEEHDRNLQALAGTLQKIVELDPSDATSTISLAKVLLLGGGLDSALKAANAAGDLDPKNAGVLALKANILFRLKDFDGAKATAQKAHELDPSDPDADVVLAAVKFSQGDTNGALQTLANVPSDRADDLGVIFLKINIFDHIGNIQQAESLLLRLIALYPNEPAFRTQLIKFYVSHNRQDDAVKQLRALAASNPNDSGAELDLVNLLLSVKGVAAGRAELVARINAGGHVFPFEIALAKLDFAQGNIADSTKLLEQLIASSNSNDDVLAARSTLAEIYLSKNNIAAAEPLISDILRADNRNATGLRLRAAIRMDRGQLDDAIGDLRTALNDQPKSPELLASLALAYERSGSIELADKSFFDATKASNFSPNVGLNYIAFLQRRGLSAQADNVLGELARRNPKNIPVLTAFAKDKLAHQDWIGAHEIADTIRRIGDKADVADQINGIAFIGQKKFNDSLVALQSAYSANPDAAQPMAALVAVYLQSQQFEKAEAFVRAALDANPSNAEALVLMGSIQLAKKAPDKAVKSFEAAIKQQPDSASGYRALANFYVQQKNVDEALKIIQAGLQRVPKDFALNLTLASLLEAKNEYEPAIAEYESMLKDQPSSMIVINNLASLLADRRTDKASLERAHTLAVLLKNSPVPQFKDTLGWIDYQREDYAGALSLLQGAVAALPNVPLIRYHLGMSYLATGQDEKASEQFKKAQELAPGDADLKMKIDTALKTRFEKKKG